MNIQEYNKILYKLKKYHTRNKLYNKDIYQQKIKKIGKKLGDYGIIQFGGVLSEEQIKKLLKDIPTEIDKKINLVLDTELYNANTKILQTNHDNIISKLNTYKPKKLESSESASLSDTRKKTTEKKSELKHKDTSSESSNILLSLFADL